MLFISGRRFKYSLIRAYIVYSLNLAKANAKAKANFYAGLDNL